MDRQILLPTLVLISSSCKYLFNSCDFDYILISPICVSLVSHPWFLVLLGAWLA